MGGKPCLSQSNRSSLTSWPDRAQIQLLGERGQRISTRSETQPVETLRQFLHGDGLPPSIALGGRILSVARGGNDADGAGARLLAGQDGARTKTHPPGTSPRPPRPVAQRDGSFFPVTVQKLVAGLAGNPELPAHIAHRFSFQNPGDKSETFVHHGAFLPRHQHPQPKGQKCYPCLQNEMSPMSRVAHDRYIKRLGRPQGGFCVSRRVASPFWQSKGCKGILILKTRNLELDARCAALIMSSPHSS